MLLASSHHQIDRITHQSVSNGGLLVLAGFLGLENGFGCVRCQLIYLLIEQELLQETNFSYFWRKKIDTMVYPNKK